jgi:tetratricopeptide (TPR) repeat protein
MFRELLAEHPEYPWNYIEYLIDRRRYGEALQLVDQRLPFGWPRPYPETYARRGVLLERLGRLSEAEDEYRRYLENRTVWFGSYTSPLPEQYRIPGSTLQKGMTFSPGDVLPKPED